MSKNQNENNLNFSSKNDEKFIYHSENDSDSNILQKNSENSPFFSPESFDQKLDSSFPLPSRKLNLPQSNLEITNISKKPNPTPSTQDSLNEEPNILHLNQNCLGRNARQLHSNNFNEGNT